MITSVKDYIRRHRRGILTTATVVCGGYIAGKYASQKIRDLQEKANAERVAKENLKRRFQQNQNDCVFTVLSLLPTLRDQIFEEMNIEKDWNRLQESRKLEKIELKLRKEREEAALMQQEKDLETGAEQQQQQQLDHQSKIDDNEGNAEADSSNRPKQETTALSTPTVSSPAPGLESSVSSLSTSFNAEDGKPLPTGILERHQKHAILENIKTKSFVRSFTVIYSITLLTLLTHIQLNLLGRFTYIWSVSVLNKTEPTIRLQRDGKEDMDAGYLDPETERLYLSLCWWLLHRGWKKCAERVEKVVEEVISSIPLKSTLNYYEAEELLIKLRKGVELENSQPFNYRTWMLPDTLEEEAVFKEGAGFSNNAENDVNNGSGKQPTITFRRLIDETKDFIDSPDFTQVATACFDEVFAIFDHHAFALTLTPNLTEPIESSIRELTPNEALNLERQSEKRLTLANLLPTIGRQAHSAISGNEYLNAFAYIKELQAFSAFVYTQYNTESL